MSEASKPRGAEEVWGRVADALPRHPAKANLADIHAARQRYDERFAAIKASAMPGPWKLLAAQHLLVLLREECACVDGRWRELDEKWKDDRP